MQHLDWHGTYNVQNELEQYGDVGDGDEAVQQHQAVDEGAAAAGEVPAEAGQLRLLTLQLQMKGRDNFTPQPLWVRFSGPKNVPSSCTHLGPAQVMEVIIIDV